MNDNKRLKEVLMEELFLIESVRWYRNATPDQICLWEAIRQEGLFFDRQMAS